MNLEKRRLKLPKAFGKKLICMLVGVFIMGMTLSVLISINLGTDPCTCLYLALSERLHISYGNTCVILNVILFGFVIWLKPNLISVGTAANMILVGYISDFFRWVWSQILPSGFFDNTLVRYGLMIPVLLIFVIGASCYMAPQLGVAPYDAIPFIIADRLPSVHFRTIRICWDIAFVVIGFAMGGVVGIVTVLTAFMLGPIITAVTKKLKLLWQ